MDNLHDKLSEMHAELIDQVLIGLKEGDRKARAEAMQLLKQNSISAVAHEDSAMSKLAAKLDFSAMADKRVIEFKRPAAKTEPQPEAL